jgi:hypothetical protein
VVGEGVQSRYMNIRYTLKSGKWHARQGPLRSVDFGAMNGWAASIGGCYYAWNIHTEMGYYTPGICLTPVLVGLGGGTMTLPVGCLG